MFVQSITALMIASLTMAQTPLPAAPDSSAPAAQVAPATSGQNALPTSQAITVPTGTAVQLTLMSAVKSKSTKAGDKVRAVVAFPVTIGTALAIPAGTFVDGDVLQVTARPEAASNRRSASTLRVSFFPMAIRWR